MAAVSRETQLEALADLVRKWNPRINLVAPDTLRVIRDRHIVDSQQVYEALENPQGSWLDLGSGGGFPGLVIVILDCSLDLTLVESDRRKAAFLCAAIRELGLAAKVKAVRVEDLSPQEADIISARALAPLDRLLGLATRHGHADTTYLFPKGERHEDEVAAASVDWCFTVDRIPSRTRSGSVILKLRNVRRA